MAKSWSGLLAPIGKPTGDGRMFAEGAITNRDLPLPLRFQRQDGQGHVGAVVVGRILKIAYEDGQIQGSGDWLNPDTTPEVLEAQELSSKGVIGPSVDLDDASVERIPIEPDAEQELAKAGEDCGCGSGVTHSAEEGPSLSVVTSGRISGVTLVQIPAFAEARALSLSDDEIEELTASAWNGSFGVGDPVAIEAEDEDGDDLDGYFVEFSNDGEDALVVLDDGSVSTVAAWRLSTPEDAKRRAWDEALVAAGARVAPPSSWFDDPKLDGPTPLQITEDGQVFGHLADWSTCHIGFRGQCVQAPPSKTSYAYFHTGAVETAEGSLLPVGKITLGTGHPSTDLDFASTVEHYDNSGTAVAVVRAGEDAYGVWVAGSLVPEADKKRVAELRRSPLSGDWRPIGGNLELVAALAVNTPGFPVLRARFASGVPVALVAAGSLAPAAREKAAEKGFALPDGSYPIRDVEELRKAIQAYGRAKDKAAAKRHIMKRARALDRADLIPEEWRSMATKTYNTAEGVTIHINLDGDMLGAVVEQQFAKRKKRRMAYDSVAAQFATLDQEMAERRAEEAATLLECIGGE